MLLFILLIIFLAPVSITLTILQDGHTDVTIGLRIWGLGGRVCLRSRRDEQGRHFTRLRRGRPMP